MKLAARILPGVSMLLLLAPYLVLGQWLLVHRGARSAAGFAVTVFALFFLLAVLARRWRRGYWLHLPLFVLGVLFTGYTVVSGQLPGDPIAYVLVTSSWEEVRGFLGLGPVRLGLLAYAGLALGYAALAFSVPTRRIFPIASARTRWSFIGGLALLAAVAASDPLELLDGATAMPAIGTALFVAGPLRDADGLVHGAHIRKTPYAASRRGGDEVHILVVGESSRRDSWSVYGYSRPTTPHLQAIAGEAVFLRNAITDANSTVYAVPMLLTGLAPGDYRPDAIRGSLVDLAKEAGYATAWLVNQDARISHLLGIAADTARYPHEIEDSAERGALAPDGVLLPELERQLAGRRGSLFVGLHVDGSHWQYSDRYPAAFARFGSGEGLVFRSEYNQSQDHRFVDAYDNSVLYTDWFLWQIIERVRRLEVPATVTFVADHGEDLFLLDGRMGHGFGVYSPHAFEIPAFVWANAAYRSAHPDKLEALAANASKEVRSHDFFYSLADLMGIHWKGERAGRSFASADFTPDSGGPVLAGGNLVARQE